MASPRRSLARTTASRNCTITTCSLRSLLFGLFLGDEYMLNYAVGCASLHWCRHTLNAHMGTVLGPASTHLLRVLYQKSLELLARWGSFLVKTNRLGHIKVMSLSVRHINWCISGRHSSLVTKSASCFHERVQHRDLGCRTPTTRIAVRAISSPSRHNPDAHGPDSPRPWASTPHPPRRAGPRPRAGCCH